MIRVFLIILFALFSSYTYSGTIHPEVSDSKYIEYGKSFVYIYKLCGSYKNGEVFCASSVAIDDHFLLTAAHVVKNAESCVIKDLDNEKSYIIKDIICHKDFEEKKFGFHDIAILYLDESLSLSFYPELYADTDEIGKVCSMSGFGITGNFNTGIINSDNKRRAGSNIIDRIENELLICSPSNNNRTELEFLIGSGDSGGGLFIKNKLAGINSCIMTLDKKPNSDYSDESGHTRISIYNSWIKKIIENKKNEK